MKITTEVKLYENAVARSVYAAESGQVKARRKCFCTSSFYISKRHLLEINLILSI